MGRFILLVVIMLASVNAEAREVTRLYDNAGRRIGFIEKRGDTETRYDSRGRRVETTVTRGSERRVYDASGNRVRTEKRK